MRIWVFFAYLLLAACSGGKQSEMIKVEPGVSLELAESRKARLSKITYDLRFSIPAAIDERIDAELSIYFTLKDGDSDLQLDFREETDLLKSLEINGAATEIDHRFEHLILPKNQLKKGSNEVRIVLTAGETSLNRDPDFLYTLFVPDRARTAFPVFDQPNLKARWSLTLETPKSWDAIANGVLAIKETDSERNTFRFAESDLISTYLFSFVAGEFQREEREVNGRQMALLHRETDPDAIERNLDEIFRLHAEALDWLEDYTRIDYPFQKFDFAAIPSFQYGGMEHVGAIQYRASTLFLSEDPSTPQQLRRANLIAHETAHMWFGDLVTMDWFNDVWTKEVFANFMAAKIVNPSFPTVNHDLNFALRLYPAAYSVDRTTGANPIRQPLPNLNEAGTLYGAIIYNKAPIMMQQLELLIGEDTFQQGIQTYLTRFANGNATWPDLIAILDELSDKDLKTWSEVWVNTPGRPVFVSQDDRSLVQADPAGEDRFWGQSFGIKDDERRTVSFSDPDVQEPISTNAIINTNGLGYGLFPANPDLIEQNWDSLSELERGAQLVTLYEQMLEGSQLVPPIGHAQFLMTKLSRETNELLIGTMLTQLTRIYHQFLVEEDQLRLLPGIEGLLWSAAIDTTRPSSTRKQYFFAALRIAESKALLSNLTGIALNTLAIEALSLSPREKSTLNEVLAVKQPDLASNLIAVARDNTKNPDARKRLDFLTPVLMPDPEGHDAFFESLKLEDNRARR
ncbi:MAG: M1 family aminopeptidase [Pseudomonadota bacterium]